MARYAVKIVEKLSRSYIVEANSFEEAKDKVQDYYKDDDFEPLNADDFDDSDIEATETFGEVAIADDDERAESFYTLD